MQSTEEWQTSVENCYDFNNQDKQVKAVVIDVKNLNPYMKIQLHIKSIERIIDEKRGLLYFQITLDDNELVKKFLKKLKV